MGSCCYLDPASLLAQSAVSIRLGRRASGCSHTLLATARRAPLNESSAQGSSKQASTNASAPTQVLQSVGVEHLLRQDGEPEPAAVHGLLTPRRSERRRGSLVRQDGALQIAVNGAAEHTVEALIPPLRYDTAGQPPPELEEGLVGEAAPQTTEGGTRHGGRLLASAQWPPLAAAAVSEIHKPTPPGGHHLGGEHLGGQQQEQQPLHPATVHGSQAQQPRQTAAPGQPYPASHAVSHAVRHQSQLERPPGATHGGDTGRRPPPPNRPSLEPVGPSGQWGGLGNELVACRTCHSLQRFLQLHGPRLDHELLGSAVVHLSQLVVEEPPEGDVEWQLVAALLDGLTQRLRGTARSFSCAQLAATVCAMSRLRCYDGPLLREAAEVAGERAEELTPRQAAGLIWAFARYHRDFGFTLDGSWSAELLAGLLPRLHTARPVELSMTLYGMALLRTPPPYPALEALLAASRAAMADYGGEELSMTIWALATMRLDPGPEWLRAFLQRCEAATRTFASGTAVVNVLYSIAVLGVRPPAEWMRHFMWQAQRRLNSMDAQGLTMLAWALGRMRYRPDRKWTTAFLRYCRAAVLQHPRDPHPLGVSTQQQALQPPGAAAHQAASQRQKELWRRQQLRLRQRLQRGGGAASSADWSPPPPPSALPLPPQAYNNLLWALVRLSYRPSGTWLLHFCSAVQPSLGCFPPQELAGTLWGLASLDWRPHEDWMLDCCVALRAGLPRYQPADCVMVLLAMAKLCSGLGYRAADGDLLNSLACQLEPFHGRLRTTTLVSVLLATTRVSPHLPPARMSSALAALLVRVRSIGVGASSGGSGGEVAGEAAAKEAAAKEAAAAPPLTARQCANAIFAVGCVARRSGRCSGVRQLCGQLLQELLPRADQLADQFNGVDLVVLLQGVAAARLRLSPDWLRRHEAQARQRLEAGALVPEQLLELHRTYRAMGYEPALLPTPSASAGAAERGEAAAKAAGEAGQGVEEQDPGLRLESGEQQQ